MTARPSTPASAATSDRRTRLPLPSAPTTTGAHSAPPSVSTRTPAPSRTMAVTRQSSRSSTPRSRAAHARRASSSRRRTTRHMSSPAMDSGAAPGTATAALSTRACGTSNGTPSVRGNALALGITPPAHVLSRGWRAFSRSTAFAASAGSRSASRSAVAAPAGPDPTMINDRRSTSALCSAGRGRLPPRSRRRRARPRSRSPCEPARRGPWPRPFRASPGGSTSVVGRPVDVCYSGPVQAEPTAVRVSSDESIRLRAGLVSLVVAIALLAVKYFAYRLTGSSAVLSDALESITNVVAAMFALGGLVFAGRPADRGHPYGHGKIEYFSAVFEGGLIAFAAVLILWQAFLSLRAGHVVHEVDLGIALTVASGAVNAALGWYLMTTGRRVNSITLVADGKHVLSDFWTSLGVFVGLLLVRLTGIAWLDPLAAAAVGVNLAVTGARLVRQAAGGLLDEEDTVLLDRL